VRQAQEMRRIVTVIFRKCEMTVDRKKETLHNLASLLLTNTTLRSEPANALVQQTDL
jgi:hypothetical protein